jgi:HK97 family phage portal protein
LSGAKYEQLATEGYAQCVVAYACINKIAVAASSIEPQLYRKKGGKLAKVETHELLDLLENPNPTQSGREFMQALVSYYQLAGNSYIFGNGMENGRKPGELETLNPGKVRVEKGQGMLPAYYEYKPDANTTRVFPVDRISGKSAVLQIKTFNPLNAWYGMSPLQAASLGVDIHTGGQKWNNRLIDNGARPSGALVVTGEDGKSGTLSEDQYTRVKQMIDEQFSGPSNAGRPMLLEGGLDWKEMSLNPKDMEFLEGKHSAARDIALAFGVPPQLLGIPGDNTYANYEEAKLAFWGDTVVPLVCVINDALNRWLTPAYGEDLYLWYDEDMIQALEPLRKQKADRINAAQYMTTNEKRRAMGMDDVEGGDVILVPFNSIPLEMVGDSVHLAEQGSPAATQDPVNG